MRIGSLCSGYAGLEMGILEVFPDAEISWFCETDPGAVKILNYRFPGILVYGDIAKMQYSQVEPVDLLAAGFPCFAKGTMILTRRGYVPIESVTTDDQVLTHRGRWRSIVSVMSRDDAPLWRVRAATPIITTPEHPFYVRTQGSVWDNSRRRKVRTFSDPMWMQAGDLKPWNSRVSHVLPPVEQPKEGDAAWWWLAGRYLADGWRMRRAKTGAGNPVAGDQGRVIIACGPGKEEELRKQLVLAGLHASESKERTVIKFHVINQPFYQFCEQFGSGAAVKALSIQALTLPPDLAEQLLAGWLAGDGSRNSSGWRGTTISKALAMGMAIIAHRARGVVASLSYHEPESTAVIEGRTVNQRPQWGVAIPFVNRRGLVDGDYAWRFVIDSAALGTTGRVYNVSVAEDESYIVDDTIVHNCQDISLAGLRRGLIPGVTRTGLWSEVARAIDELRPELVFLENTDGLLSAKASSPVEWCPDCLGNRPEDPVLLRALGAVLGDLADLGYDADWCTVPASSAGAPHRRKRVFALASQSRGEGLERGAWQERADGEPAACGLPAAA